MFRVVFRIVVVLSALRVAGALVTRRLNSGSEEANEFTIATAFGGVDRESRAPALRQGDVLAFCGGVQLDLRDAVLDAAGADIRLRARMGGIQVIVAETWRVTVEQSSFAGGVDVSVTPDEELAPDAPVLRVAAKAFLGGIQVTTADDDEADDSNG